MAPPTTVNKFLISAVLGLFNLGVFWLNLAIEDPKWPWLPYINLAFGIVFCIYAVFNLHKMNKEGW